MADFTDPFTGTGALDGNWTVDHGAIAIVTNNALSSGIESSARYTGGTFQNDQYSASPMVSITGSLRDCGVHVRGNAPGGNEYYDFYVPGDLDPGNGFVRSRDGGGFTQIGATYTVTVADTTVIRIEIVGDTITPYVAGVALATRAGGGLIASGKAGISSTSNSFAAWASWAGGDLGAAAVSRPAVRVAGQAVMRAATR